MKKYVKANEGLSINIDWDEFCNYYDVSLDDLIENENRWEDYEVEHFVERAIESVMDEGVSDINELISAVKSYVTNLDNVSDEAAYEGISDAGLLIGLTYNTDMIVNMCKEAIGE